MVSNKPRQAPQYKHHNMAHECGLQWGADGEAILQDCCSLKLISPWKTDLPRLENGVKKRWALRPLGAQVVNEGFEFSRGFSFLMHSPENLHTHTPATTHAITGPWNFCKKTWIWIDLEDKESIREMISSDVCVYLFKQNHPWWPSTVGLCLAQEGKPGSVPRGLTYGVWTWTRISYIQGKLHGVSLWPFFRCLKLNIFLFETYVVETWLGNVGRRPRLDKYFYKVSRETLRKKSSKFRNTFQLSPS